MENNKTELRLTFQNVLSITFSILLLVGIIVCAICDVAISGAFTWSLYPISSILFVWFVFIGTEALLLTTKYGCGRLVWSKLAAAFLFTVGYYLVSYLLCTAVVGLLIGFPGGSLPLVPCSRNAFSGGFGNLRQFLYWQACNPLSMDASVGERDSHRACRGSGETAVS